MSFKMKTSWSETEKSNSLNLVWCMFMYHANFQSLQSKIILFPFITITAVWLMPDKS